MSFYYGIWGVSFFHINFPPLPIAHIYFLCVQYLPLILPGNSETTVLSPIKVTECIPSCIGTMIFLPWQLLHAVLCPLLAQVHGSPKCGKISPINVTLLLI